MHDASRLSFEFDLEMSFVVESSCGFCVPERLQAKQRCPACGQFQGSVLRKACKKRH